MNKFGQRLLILSVLVCFAVFFGVDMATKGIGDTGGPVTQAVTKQQDSRVVTASDLMPEPVRKQAVVEVMAEAKPLQPGQQATSTQLNSSETAVEGLANSAGRLLRSTAQGGVEMMVALIDGILK